MSSILMNRLAAVSAARVNLTQKCGGAEDVSKVLKITFLVRNGEQNDEKCGYQKDEAIKLLWM